ncbi:ATP-binding protein [Streptomyces lunalinharesii]|uniref:ATP-binding protein n=1 Tax=Streptomyces lunalinharesii TaxID=333384 RepID=UPI0031D4713B
MRSKGIAMSTRARPVVARLAPAVSASVTYRIPSEPRSAGWARRELRRQLRRWGVVGELVGVAELLVSELVANAVRAQGEDGAWVGVRFVFSGERLRLEVRDGSAEQPVLNDDVEEDAECGRGLGLVDAVASGWGVVPDGIGKVVWAELTVAVAAAGTE